MVATIAQDIGDYLPQVILVFFADENYVYMVEEPIEHELTKINRCQAIWDSISSASEAELIKYRESKLQDTSSLSQGFNLEENAWDEYCACYRTKLVKDGQFSALKRQMDKILKDLQRQTNYR